jgi:hypothetical protein
LVFKIFNHLKWRLENFYFISFPQFFYFLFLKPQIYSGPFSGMRYIRSSVGSVILPKIIGTYEDELHFIFDKLKSKNYSLFIDIGAAEGFYVVGIGKYIFNNFIPVIAYESSVLGQKKIRDLSFLNSFFNVIIKGTCDINSLKEDIYNNRPFILMDVEGAELYLLDTMKVDFAACDILVEVHTSFINNLDLILIERFKFSHKISVVQPRSKIIPENTSYPKWVYRKAFYLTNEFRGEQCWLWLESKKYLK